MTEASVHEAHGDVGHVHRHGTRPWFPPVLVGAIALGACVLLSFRDPNESGSWGYCPFKLMTGGLDCPGCGLLRGTRALTHGNLAEALDHNILIFPILGAILVSYSLWLAGAMGWRDAKVHINPKWAWVAGAILLVFWVVRNLPWFPYLDSGVSS